MSSLQAFLDQNGWLSLGVLALQIGFIVHVFAAPTDLLGVRPLLLARRRRAAVLLFRGAAECARAPSRLRSDRGAPANVDQRIRARRETLAEVDTLQHRVALAAQLTRAGRLEDAEETLLPLRHGLYCNDPGLLFTLADLKICQGRDAEARDLLLQLDARTKVLLAETLVRLGDKEEAKNPLDAVEKTFRRANGSYRGQEREWFKLAGELRGRVR